MSIAIESEPGVFVDRRNSGSSEQAGVERRQFTNSHEGLSPEAKEVALAIDRYKLTNRRRFITYEEVLSVIKSIGYSKLSVNDR